MDKTEQAFPVYFPGINGDKLNYGITRREYFAAKAMQAIISKGGSDFVPNHETAAKAAVVYANALILQLDAEK